MRNNRRSTEEIVHNEKKHVHRAEMQTNNDFHVFGRAFEGRGRAQ